MAENEERGPEDEDASEGPPSPGGEARKPFEQFQQVIDQLLALEQ